MFRSVARDERPRPWTGTARLWLALAALAGCVSAETNRTPQAWEAIFQRRCMGYRQLLEGVLARSGSDPLEPGAELPWRRLRAVDSRIANMVERDPGEPMGSRANYRVGPAGGPRVVCTVHGSGRWIPGERPQPDPWEVDCRATMHQLLGAMIRYNLDHDTQLTEFPWDELVAKGYLRSLPSHVNTGPNSQWMYYWSPAFGGTVSCRDACAVVSMELGVVRPPLPPIPPPPPMPLRNDPNVAPGPGVGFLGR